MRFVFATMNAGSESLLKAEVARAHPGWRPAYMRPGLVTFKVEAEGEIDEAVALDAVFARAWGAGIGPAADARAVVEAARAIGAQEKKVRLHVFARDRRGAEAAAPEDVERARALRAEILATGGALFEVEPLAQPGDRVLDVIVAEEDPAYVGVHRQTEGRIAAPGGRIELEVPAEAPPRAYRKIEELIAWSGVAPGEGDLAVELGAAPGGAAYALVQRGVSVLAIDPASIDRKVLAYVGPGGARVRHLRLAVDAVAREQLPEGARWLLCDLRLAPPLVLRHVQRIAAGLESSLEGLFLTFELSEPSMAEEIPRWLARIAEMGFAPRAIQLPSHRQEIGVVAVRPRRGGGRRAQRARAQARETGGAPRRGNRDR